MSSQFASQQTELLRTPRAHSWPGAHGGGAGGMGGVGGVGGAGGRAGGVDMSAWFEWRRLRSRLSAESEELLVAHPPCIL